MTDISLSSGSTLSIGDLIDKGKMNGQQILVITLCLFFNMLDGFDITAMAVTVSAIGSEMHLAEDKLGLVFSFSLAGMMIGAMLLASLSDVYGRRPVVIASLFVVGSSVLATAYVDNLWALIALRFVSGLGAGAMLAAQATLASEYSPERYRALAVAAVTAGYPLGAMMTGLVAEQMLPDYGWRSMFIAGGSITLVMTGCAYALLPESLQFLCAKQPPRALDKVNRILGKFEVGPVDCLPESASAVAGEARGETIFSKMLKLLTPEHRTSTLILWSAFFMCFCAMYFLLSWTPKLLVNAGFSSQVGNYAFSLFNLGGVLGIFLLGGLATRWPLSSLIGLFLTLAAAAMCVFAIVPLNQLLVLSLILLIGILLQGGFTGLYAAAAKLYPTEIRSTGVGWAIGLGRFGAVVGPAVGGYMMVGGVALGTNFAIFAVPVVLGGVLAFYLHLR